MISFISCLLLLIGGYFVYGKVVENTFAPDDRETPAVKINDGVDYVVMPQWKLFLIQLLFTNAGITNILSNKLFWLIIMAVGVGLGVLTNFNYVIPEIWNKFTNMHPSETPIWSFMFITVACGAISGFHATQSHLMARCMKSERQGHFVFYGAMVSEGVIAIVWAASMFLFQEKKPCILTASGKGGQRKVKDNRPLADFLPTITIAAKNLATEMTNYNVEEKDLQGESAITAEHVQNNSTGTAKKLTACGISPCPTDCVFMQSPDHTSSLFFFNVSNMISCV